MTFYQEANKAILDNRLQAKLNREYDESTKTRFRNETYNIKPQLEQYRTLEEERQDLTYQYNLARKHLMSLVRPDVANDVLAVLDEDRIYRLNSYWKPFSETFKGRTNITKDSFIQALERFDELIGNTKGTLIEIPLTAETISQLPDNVYQRWVDWSEQKIDPLTEQLINLNDLLRETALVINKNVEDLKQEVTQQVRISGQYRRVEGELPPPPEMREEEFSPFKGKAGVPIMRGPPPALGAELAKATAKRAKTNRITDMFPQLSVQRESDTELTPDQARAMFAAIQDAGLADDVNTKQTRILVRPFGRTITQKSQIKSVLDDVFASGGAAPPKTEGFGMRRVFRGRGRVESQPIREVGYLLFGKTHCFNRNDLKNGILSLRRESNKVCVPNFPSDHVSPDLLNFVLNFCNSDGILDKDMFNALDDGEQSLFLKYARKAKVNLGNVPMMSKSDKEDSIRYRLLLGELDAGNLSVIPELRILVLKLYRSKRITHNELHRVMYYFFHLFGTPQIASSNKTPVIAVK